MFEHEGQYEQQPRSFVRLQLVQSVLLQVCLLLLVNSVLHQHYAGDQEEC